MGEISKVDSLRNIRLFIKKGLILKKIPDTFFIFLLHTFFLLPTFNAQAFPTGHWNRRQSTITLLHHRLVSPLERR